MPGKLPNLWRIGEDATRLYEMYLLRMQMQGQHDRVVTASRTIRRYAARGPGANAGLFTFSFEIDALCALQNYRAAWRQLRLREVITFGRRLDLATRKWSKTDESDALLQFYYAPLLYFLGRYQLGCVLLERALSLWCNNRKVRSFDYMFRVYNGDSEPANRYRVTLSHFYARLGQCLDQWQYWKRFVFGFHPRLFRLSGVDRELLLAHADQLPIFFDSLMEIRERRTTSGIASGQSDLVDSAAKVKKRQQAYQRKLKDSEKRIKPMREYFDRKLRELFPAE
jgi:hypothetical protein